MGASLVEPALASSPSLSSSKQLMSESRSSNRALMAIDREGVLFVAPPRPQGTKNRDSRPPPPQIECTHQIPPWTQPVWRTPKIEAAPNVTNLPDGSSRGGLGAYDTQKQQRAIALRLAHGPVYSGQIAARCNAAPSYNSNPAPPRSC